MTLGEAARSLGVAKGTISKAIATGKLSASKREDGSWNIDGAELARYHEVNGHRFASSTPVRSVTADVAAIELKAKLELAEQRLADLREQLTAAREQCEKWETVALRLTVTEQKREAETPKPMSWWRWLRSTG